MSQEERPGALEAEARKKVDGYLGEVGRSLAGVAREERKSILNEIETALVEKIQLERASGAGVDRVLEDFGSPEEVARGYAGVAAPAPGPGVRLFFLFLAAWSVVLGIVGLLIIQDYLDALQAGREPWASQLLMGIFWIVLMATLLGLVGLQLRRQALVPRLGPFTALAFMLPTLYGISSLAWYDDISWLLPMVPGEWRTPVVVAIGLAVVVPTVAGLWLLAGLSGRERAREGRLENIVPAGRPRPERRWMALATLAILSMFVLANGTWLYHEATVPAGPDEGARRFIGSEPLGGPYDASIEHWTVFYNDNWWDDYRIAYTINGTRINGSILLEMRPALDWIKSNTSGNDTVVSWWDYGHAVRGYTGRDGAIYMASKNLVDTIADRNEEGRPWEPEERVRAVSNILLAQNETQLRQGMAAFGARYILTTQRDSSSIAYAIVRGAGKNPDDYLGSSEGIYYPKENARDMFLFKTWAGGDFDGTTVVYKDINTMIVELT